MAKEKHEEELYYDEEDGSMAVHQLITESYQSGSIDQLAGTESKKSEEKDK